MYYVFFFLEKETPSRCIYCDEHWSDLSGHLQNIHKEEELVHRAMSNTMNICQWLPLAKASCIWLIMVITLIQYIYYFTYTFKIQNQINLYITYKLSYTANGNRLFANSSKWYMRALGVK